MLVFFVDFEQVEAVWIIFFLDKKDVLLLVLSVNFFYRNFLVRQKIMLLATPEGITFPKSTIETLEIGVRYLQS